MMSEGSPIVTVVIATYNRPQVLRCAIESVLWQTLEDFELWVVGDLCTDNTAEVVQEYASDPRVNWHNLSENSGYQSRPNNEGIRRARGKYIAYLNHDDVWLPLHLKATVERLEESGADFVFSILQEYHDRSGSRAEIPLLPNLPRAPEATAVVHRKDVVERIGNWRDVNETYSYPRVEFFRRGLFADLKFEILPLLTAIKFNWDAKETPAGGPQRAYMERLRTDPDCLNRELSGMLIDACSELARPRSFKRWQERMSDRLRAVALRRGIDPAALKFWQRKGHQIRVWRKGHRLPEDPGPQASEAPPKTNG